VTNDIEVRRLINFETATDGTAVRLLVEDIAGPTIGRAQGHRRNNWVDGGPELSSAVGPAADAAR
jgi:hypothetical protein